MIQPFQALERLSFMEQESEVGYIGMERTVWIIDQLKLTFAAAKPPPSPVFEEVALAMLFRCRLLRRLTSPSGRKYLPAWLRGEIHRPEREFSSLGKSKFYDDAGWP
jgi:hypothetical protein